MDLLDPRTSYDPGDLLRPGNRVVRLEMFRGDSKKITRQVFVNPLSLQLTSIDQGAAELPPAGFAVQNLTGFHVEFTAKYHFGDPDNQAVMRLDNQTLGGVTLTNATIGQLVVTTPAISTRGFPDGTVVLVWDLQVVDTAGNVSTVAAGTLAVYPDATNAIT